MSAESSNGTAKLTADPGSVESGAASAPNPRTRKRRPTVAPEQAQFVTLKQAAAKLQVSTASLLRARARGELKMFLVGNALRIRRADLDTFLERSMWTPQLSAVRTARPRAGRRRRVKDSAPPSPTSKVVTPEA